MYGVNTEQVYHHPAGQRCERGEGRGSRNEFINAGLEDARIIKMEGKQMPVSRSICEPFYILKTSQFFYCKRFFNDL